MWIKKIEKSNKPFHIQPTLYNDIRKYVEQAFLLAVALQVSLLGLKVGHLWLQLALHGRVFFLGADFLLGVIHPGCQLHVGLHVCASLWALAFQECLVQLLRSGLIVI